MKRVNPKDRTHGIQVTQALLAALQLLEQSARSLSGLCGKPPLPSMNAWPSWTGTGANALRTPKALSAFRLQPSFVQPHLRSVSRTRSPAADDDDGSRGSSCDVHSVPTTGRRAPSSSIPLRAGVDRRG